MNSKTKRNISSSKKDIKAVVLLWSATMFGALFAFLIQVSLARILAPEKYGQFAVSLTIISTLLPFASFGVHSFWLKVFGEEGWRATRWLKSSFMVLVITISIVITSIITIAFLFIEDYDSRKLLIILSSFILGQVAYEVLSAKYQLEEKYLILSAWQFSQHFIRFLLIFISYLLLTSDFTFYTAASIYSIVSITFFILAIYSLFKTYKGKLELKGHGKQNISTESHYPEPSIKRVLQGVWPFGLSGFFHLVYFQSDLILIKEIKGSTDAGIYNVGFIIMVATLLLPSVIYDKYFIPKLHRWMETDLEKVRGIYKNGNLIMFLLGVTVMLCVLLVSNFGIPIIFGEKYVESIPLLNILAISIPLLFVASSVGSFLVTKNNMKLKVKIMGGIAVLNLILNCMLIPEMGATGAAITTSFSNLVLLATYFIVVQRVVFNKT